MAKLDLTPFLERVQKENLNMEAILVEQDGQEVARHFWAPEHRRNQYSVSKSFTSAAVGFAVAEGLFALTDSVLAHFAADAPENPPENLQKLTVRDLLTMAPGQDAAYLMGGDREKLAERTDDFVRFCLAQPFPYAPGTHFKYNNMGPYLAGVLVQRKAGCSLVDYLMPRLFSPLGIARPHWETDPRGQTFGAGGLEISPGELLSFIRLYLNDGQLGGRQILSRDWVRQSEAVQVETAPFVAAEHTDSRFGYGFLFWRGQHNSFRADGKYAKFAIVLRDLRAVAVLNAQDARQQGVLDAFWDTVYPQLER